MKTFKRALAVVLMLAMLVPLGMFQVSADTLGDNWTLLCGKYGSNTNKLLFSDATTVNTTGFSYSENEDGGIDIVVPDKTVFPGSYPTAVLTSQNATVLDGLTVTASFSDDFDFTGDGMNASNIISMLWTNSKITALTDGTQSTAGSGLYYSGDAYTNGLRNLAPEDGKALCVSVLNAYTAYNNTKYASNVYISLFKGDSYVDKGDSHPGYRWCFTSRNIENNGSGQDRSGIKQKYECISVAGGLTFVVRPDTTLGYVVAVNGTEYYKGDKVAYFPNNTGALTDADYDPQNSKYTDSMTYAKDDINLSALKGVSGYLSMGLTDNANSSADMTVETINCIDAAAWKGETIGTHTHTFIGSETVDATCTTDGHTAYTCPCGARYHSATFKFGHSWVTYDKTDATCTTPGLNKNWCKACKIYEDVAVPALGHTWGEYVVTTKATSTADGEMTSTCSVCGETRKKSYKYSDADKIADNWFVSGENRQTLAGMYPDGVVFTTLNNDGTITLKDTKQQYTDGKSYNNITKITSTHTSELNDFSATVQMLPTSSTDSLYPTSVSFVWTNQFDNYCYGGQYSSGLYYYYQRLVDDYGIEYKKPNSYKNSSLEDSRIGYAWDHYIKLEECTFNVTLNDAVVLWSTYKWGTPDDNKYDFLTYSSIYWGDYWNGNLYVLDLSHDEVDATKPITVSPSYYYDEDEEANILGFSVNGKYYTASGFANSQTYEQMYYFGVAAYGDGINNKGASFTLLDVCGQKPVNFTGYTDPDKCEHEWGEWEVAYDWINKCDSIATCNHTGQEIKTCELCGATQTRKIERPAHTYSELEVITPPTCMETGKGTHVCEAKAYASPYACGNTEDVIIPATGVHIWGEWAIDPDNSANDKRTCTTCGKPETRAHEHIWGAWVVTTEPTCVDAGEETRECSVCHETETQPVAATGNHSWGDWHQTKVPSCADGEEEHECNVCHTIETRSIPATETHVWGDWHQTVAPTCADGEEERECSVCNTIDTRPIPAVDEHSWGTWETTTEPTCGAAGEETRECTVCHTTDTRPVEATGEHTWGAWEVTTEPTCVDKGAKRRECTVCHQLEIVDIDATGIHTWGAWDVTTHATYFADGEETRECTVCHTPDTRPIDKLPNPFEDVADGKWYYTCALYSRQYGYMEGTTPTTFAPNTVMSRAMFVQMLAKIDGVDLTQDKYQTTEFTDVPAGKWYTSAVAWAAENNLASGIGDGMFGAKNDITREQIAMFFYVYANYKGYDTTDTTDIDSYVGAAKVHDWAIDAMKWAVASELITGKDGNDLAPRDVATRSQVAQVSMKFAEKYGLNSVD